MLHRFPTKSPGAFALPLLMITLQAAAASPWVSDQADVSGGISI